MAHNRGDVRMRKDVIFEESGFLFWSPRELTTIAFKRIGDRFGDDRETMGKTTIKVANLKADDDLDVRLRLRSETAAVKNSDRKRKMSVEIQRRR
jgi:hypothetical protein